MTPLLHSSTLGIIDAPVVITPDVDSKMASTGAKPERKNGSAPHITEMNHMRAMSARMKIGLIDLGMRVITTIGNPITIIADIGSRNGNTS